jgi:ssDNA-binding Zn-finger/Zn-ribbon topoisomerase 1
MLEMADQDFTDRDLECADCRSMFVFTAGEQSFFQQKGFTEPKRCPKCRQARKQRQGSSSDARGNR